MAALVNVIAFLAILVILFVLRLLYCIAFPAPTIPKSKDTTFCTMIVLGSGGHTAEMLTTIKNLDRTRYRPRHYVAAKTDSRSLQRAKDSESSSKSEIDHLTDLHFHSIHRSREVHQSWSSTVFSTLYSTMESFVLLLRVRPDVIICNGPGTCIPILVGGLLLRVLFVQRNIKLIFLESFCRVDDLSMSGKIAYRFVNLFIVQWPQLVERYPQAKYIGRIF